jgi:hypothetical protein
LASSGGSNGGGSSPGDPRPGSGRGYAESDKCTVSGGVCLNKDGVSFSVGCEGYGQIEFSTSGEVGLTIGGKPIGISIGTQ